MPDDLTSALDQIRADIGARDELVARMQLGRSYPVAEFNAAQDQLAERVPLLLAAVDEVLAETDEFTKGCPERLVTREYAAECFRAAIVRGLTKGEGGDG